MFLRGQAYAGREDDECRDSHRSLISRASGTGEEKVPQMSRVRAPALAPAEWLRSAQTSTDCTEPGMKMSSCSSRSQEGAVAKATKVLARDRSKGRLKKKKTICGLNKRL